MSLKVVPFGNKRYAIADATGKIINDAGGYGFKSEESAYNASDWKRKTKSNNNHTPQEQEYLKWYDDNKYADRHIKDYVWEIKKETQLTDSDLTEIFGKVEDLYTIQIPDSIKKIYYQFKFIL